MAMQKIIGEPDYGSPAFVAWKKHATQNWHNYTHHDFVKELGSGELPKSSFIHYLIQDYIYLTHYSRCWALAVVKAETLSEMRAASGIVEALINDEMNLHVEICAREGISRDQLESAAEAPENMAYTRYVLEAGYSGDLLDLLAALAPCVFGYGEIGHRLLQTSQNDTPYREWIETYGGDDYQSLCKDTAKLIESAIFTRLGSDPTGLPRWKSLCRKFDQATKLEISFWQMGLRGYP